MATGGLVLTTASFNGSNFGIAVEIDGTPTFSIAPLQGQGDLGTTAFGVIGKGGVVTVTWIGGSGSSLFDGGQVLGTLEFTMTNSQTPVGNPQTYSWSFADMVPMEGKVVIRDRTYAMHTQSFMCINSSGNCLTQS